MVGTADFGRVNGMVEQPGHNGDSTSRKGGKSAVTGPMYVHLHGKRVDVSRWASQHPGGKKILAIFRDRDATEQFTAMHSKDAQVRDRSLTFFGGSAYRHVRSHVLHFCSI